MVSDIFFNFALLIDALYKQYALRNPPLTLLDHKILSTYMLPNHNQNKNELKTSYNSSSRISCFTSQKLTLRTMLNFSKHCRKRPCILFWLFVTSKKIRTIDLKETISFIFGKVLIFQRFSRSVNHVSLKSSIQGQLRKWNKTPYYTYITSQVFNAGKECDI